MLALDLVGAGGSQQRLRGTGVQLVAAQVAGAGLGGAVAVLQDPAQVEVPVGAVRVLRQGAPEGGLGVGEAAVLVQAAGLFGQLVSIQPFAVWVAHPVPRDDASTAPAQAQNGPGKWGKAPQEAVARWTGNLPPPRRLRGFPGAASGMARASGRGAGWAQYTSSMHRRVACTRRLICSDVHSAGGTVATSGWMSR